MKACPLIDTADDAWLPFERHLDVLYNLIAVSKLTCRWPTRAWMDSDKFDKAQKVSALGSLSARSARVETKQPQRGHNRTPTDSRFVAGHISCGTYKWPGARLQFSIRLPALPTYPSHHLPSLVADVFATGFEILGVWHPEHCNHSGIAISGVVACGNASRVGLGE